MRSSRSRKKKYINFQCSLKVIIRYLIIVVMLFVIISNIILADNFISKKHQMTDHLGRQKFLTSYHRQQNNNYSSVLHRKDVVIVKTLIENHKENRQSFTLPPEVQFPPYPAHLTPSSGSWQNISSSRYRFLVFSAFFENRKEYRSVRVIGATKTKDPESVWCRMWYKTNGKNATSFISRTIRAETQVINEHWYLEYSACFVLCPLMANEAVPAQVSLVAKLKSAASNLFTVINNYNDFRKPSNKFAVCIKPLHSDYNKALNFLEFMELNRILGVEHFTFYNYTVGPQVGCILQDYVDRGFATLLPWQLNLLSEIKIREENLFAALNDCLYRSMYLYSHVIFIDLDEYIIPKFNETLQKLVEYLNTLKFENEKIGCYSFQNAFFYLLWSDDDSVYDSHDSVAANLLTLKKTRRRSELYPHRERSKYICQPELVLEVGNHFVWESLDRYQTMESPDDVAILHHYRLCEFGGDNCTKLASTVDTTAFKYKDKLVEAVRKKFGDLKEKCNLNELPPPPPPPRKNFYWIMNMLKGWLKTK